MNYETIEVELDDDIQKTMIDMFVKISTTDIEWEMYNDLLKEGVFIETALFRVAMNFVIHQALIRQIEEMNKEEIK